jgi:hypothetical protein
MKSEKKIYEQNHKENREDNSISYLVEMDWMNEWFGFSNG